MAARYHPKVVDTLYAVLINKEVADTFEKLSDARKLVRNMRITEDITEVQIIKQCTTQTILDVLKPEIKRTLSATDFNWVGDE